MGMISTLFERRGVVDPSTLAAPKPWLVDFFGGGKVKSGIRVTEDNVLGLAPVWACVQVISSDLAKLPIRVMQRKSDLERVPINDHQVFQLLNRRCNTDPGVSFSFRQMLIAHTLIWGNAFAYIERDGAGRPLALWPMLPNRTRLRRTNTKEIVYDYYSAGAETATLSQDEVLHIRGLSFDGIVGYSVVAKARESWGAAMACEQFAASFWANGARPSGVLTHPGKLSPMAEENIKKSFNELYAGSENAGHVVLNQEGMTFQPMSINPDDAQFLETRNFTRSAVASWFRLSPHKIGDLSRMTFSNIEQLNKQHVDEALMHWAVACEQEFGEKLFTRSERDRGLYVQHNFNAFLRGDMQSRSKAYFDGRNAGWLSVNDIRAEEEKPSIGPKGDIYLQPVNMIDVANPPSPKATKLAPADPAAPTPPAPPAQTDPAARKAAVRQVVMAFRPALGEVLRRNMKSVAERAARAAKQPGGVGEEFMKEHREHMHGQVLATVESVFEAAKAIGVMPRAKNSVSSAAYLMAIRHCSGLETDIEGRKTSEEITSSLARYGDAALAEERAEELLVGVAHELVYEIEYGGSHAADLGWTRIPVPG